MTALSVLEWAKERYANTLRIGASKRADRAGWLEDAAYWGAIVEQLTALAAAQAERDALKVRDAQWQHKWSTAVGTGTSNTAREADRADAAEAALAAAQAECETLRKERDEYQARACRAEVAQVEVRMQDDPAQAALTEARRVLTEAQPHLEVLMRSTNAGTVRDARRMLLSQIAAVLAREGQATVPLKPEPPPLRELRDGQEPKAEGGTRG